MEGLFDGDLNMNGNRVTGLPSPTSNDEPVTKGYADTHYSNSATHQGPKGDVGTEVQKGPREMWHQKVTLVHLDQREIREMLVQKVTRDQRVRKVMWDQKVIKEQLVQKDQKVKREIRVCEETLALVVPKGQKGVRVILEQVVGLPKQRQIPFT